MLILADTTITSVSFNLAKNDNAYFGYMYGTPASTNYADTHANINNSNIKITADNWYASTLSSYSNYISDVGYCNDRVLSSGGGYSNEPTYYTPSSRNSSSSPRLSISTGCVNASSDLFTTTSSSIGNKKLTYPIALITLDEAIYAGAKSNNFSNYLKFNTRYFTMSPLRYYRLVSDSYEYGINEYGTIDYYMVNQANGFRASISLKPSVVVTSGTGKYDDPYVIQ